MKTVKTTYKSSVNKRMIQKRLYDSIKGKYDHLIGLGGPDLNDYLKVVCNAGIKSATIYEYNVDQLFRQMSTQLNVLPTQVVYKDILNSPSNKPNTFYDLDFCCSIQTARKHVRKFRNDPSMFTFALRPMGMEDTVREFVKIKQGNKNFELILEEIKPTHRMYNLHLEGSNQQVYIYFDSFPMLVITNF